MSEAEQFIEVGSPEPPTPADGAEARPEPELGAEASVRDAAYEGMSERAPSAPEVATRAAVDEASEPPEPRRSGYRQLEDVITDESFPEVDLALRRGRHIHKGDERWYELLNDAQPLLETFYRRYGCELEQRSDGYFFLLPLTDSLGKRHLGVPEMIVGQGLALCFLDPSSVQSGGVITREELLNQLASVMGTDALMQTLNPKRKRADERVMQRTVRLKVAEALRKLAQLGFVELVDAEQIRLWPSLMRFAEPVRGLDAPSEALKRLIERGEVSLGPGDEEPADAEAETDADADADVTAEPESETETDAEEAPAAAQAGIEAPDAATWAELGELGDFGAEPEPAALAGFHAEAEAEADAAALDFDAEPEPAALAGFQAEAEAEADAAALDFDTEPEPEEGELDSAQPAEDLEGSLEQDGALEGLPPELDLDWDTLPGEKA